MNDSGVQATLEWALGFWQTVYTEIVRLLTVSPTQFGGGGIYSVIVGINSAMQAVGMSLLTVFCMISVIRHGTIQDMRRPEAIFRIFLRIILGKAVISYSMVIMTFIWTTGIQIVNGIGGTVGGQKDLHVPAAIVQKINELNLLERIIPQILACLGGVIIVALSLAVLLVVYGRFFKLFLYIAVSPIAFSTFAGEETSMVGKHFIKSFAGVCLEGALIALACVIFSKFTSAVDMTGYASSDSAMVLVMGYIASVVFQMLILLGIVRASDQISREMLG